MGFKSRIIKENFVSKNEVVVVNSTALSDENYGNMEAFATNACFQLSNTMDALLVNDEDTPLDVENIDRAIDCADAMVKMLAMFHKGREIQSKVESLGQLNASN